MYPVELGDGIKPFVATKMYVIDPNVYTPQEIDNLFAIPHKIIAYIDKKGKILAFCCIMVNVDSFKMCYTWCETTRAGKVAYARGIEYMIANYSPMQFGPGALELNKIQRLIHE